LPVVDPIDGIVRQRPPIRGREYPLTERSSGSGA